MDRRPNRLINMMQALALSGAVLMTHPIEARAQDPVPDIEQPKDTPEEDVPVEKVAEPILPPPIKTHFTVQDTLAVVNNASLRARCIIASEVGHGGNGYGPWDPETIGAQGEEGIAQLHPQGKLQEFYDLGYTNSFDPYQEGKYLEDALKRGQASHWTAVKRGLC